MLTLLEYLTALSTDAELMDEYKANREQAMRNNKLSENDITLVLNNNYDAIRNLIGSDYDISTNHIIKVYKKS